jgi:hypothetical protein
MRLPHQAARSANTIGATLADHSAAGGLAALIVAGFAGRSGNEKQELTASATTAPSLTMTSSD